MALPPSTPRVALLARLGYRQLKPAELAARGLRASSRAYLGPDGTIVPRRRAEEMVLGKTFGALQRERYAETGVRPLAEATRLARAYAQRHGIGIRAAQRSPDFRAARKKYLDPKWWDRMREQPFAHRVVGPRSLFDGRQAEYWTYDADSEVAELLEDLGLREPDDWWDVGNSPEAA